MWRDTYRFGEGIVEYCSGYVQLPRLEVFYPVKRLFVLGLHVIVVLCSSIYSLVIVAVVAVVVVLLVLVVVVVVVIDVLLRLSVRALFVTVRVADNTFLLPDVKYPESH